MAFHKECWCNYYSSLAVHELPVCGSIASPWVLSGATSWAALWWGGEHRFCPSHRYQLYKEQCALKETCLGPDTKFFEASRTVTHFVLVIPVSKLCSYIWKKKERKKRQHRVLCSSGTISAAFSLPLYFKDLFIWIQVGGFSLGYKTKQHFKLCSACLNLNILMRCHIWGIEVFCRRAFQHLQEGTSCSPCSSWQRWDRRIRLRAGDLALDKGPDGFISLGLVRGGGRVSPAPSVSSRAPRVLGGPPRSAGWRCRRCGQGAGRRRAGGTRGRGQLPAPGWKCQRSPASPGRAVRERRVTSGWPRAGSPWCNRKLWCFAAAAAPRRQSDALPALPAAASLRGAERSTARRGGAGAALPAASGPLTGLYPAAGSGSRGGSRLPGRDGAERLLSPSLKRGVEVIYFSETVLVKTPRGEYWSHPFVSSERYFCALWMMFMDRHVCLLLP